jgi:hypothetical protein
MTIHGAVIQIFMDKTLIILNGYISTSHPLTCSIIRDIIVLNLISIPALLDLFDFFFRFLLPLFFWDNIR